MRNGKLIYPLTLFIGILLLLLLTNRYWLQQPDETPPPIRNSQAKQGPLRSDAQIERNLEGTLQRLKAQPLNIPDCYFDLKKACLSGYYLFDQGEAVYLGMTGDIPFSRSVVSGILYGDVEKLPTYTLIAPNNFDSPDTVADLIVDEGFQHDNNPLVVAAFVNMVSDPEWPVAQTLVETANQKLRAYYDVFAGNGKSEWGSGFSAAEKQVITRLLDAKTATAAEKAVITFGVIHFEPEFVADFDQEWGRLHGILSKQGSFWVTGNPNLDETRKSKSISYCEQASFYWCAWDQSLVECKPVAYLDHLCQKPNSPVRK